MKQEQEQNEEQKKENITLPISEILPLGYLYLIVLGITSDSIFYGLLGVNIMSFSSILDVLLSPVVQLTSNIIIPIFIILVPFISYLTMQFIKKVNDKKKLEQKKNIINLNVSLRTSWLIFTAVMVFLAFIGLGVGRAVATKERLENGNFAARNKLTFQDGKTVEVRIIGNNSSYIFYVSKGGKSVIISPIQDNITKIEELESKE
jgi:heme/copper-type cytochrome/quinol oxidase subunit 2